MRIPFIKMHGLGNDFIVLDAREQALPALEASRVRALADRRRGIGCDQLIVLEPSQRADFAMRIYNQDGGEVKACGNASRAVAILHGRPARLETKGGIITLEPSGNHARIDMGTPRFGWEDIPLAYAMDTAQMPISWGPLEAPMALNVGNPHAVFFVEANEAAQIDLAVLGPEIEADPVFEQGVNVNLACVEEPQRIALQVWERGAGLTRACGTGACATAVAGIKKGLVQSPVTLALPGGELFIEWREGGHIQMSGPATEAFRGEFEWDDFGSASPAKPPAKAGAA